MLLLELSFTRAQLETFVADAGDFDDESHAAAFRAVVRALSHVSLEDYSLQHDVAALLLQIKSPPPKANGPASPAVPQRTQGQSPSLPARPAGRRSLSPIARAPVLDDSDLGPVSDEDNDDEAAGTMASGPCTPDGACPHDRMLVVDLTVWRSCARRRALLAPRLLQYCPSLIDVVGESSA